MVRKSVASVALAAGVAAGGFLPIGTALGTSAEAAPYRAMHVGDRGAQVRWVQQQLHVRVTGFYGAETRNAVVGFQRWWHIPLTGSVGQATMFRMRQVAAYWATHRAPVRRPAPAPRRVVVRRPAPVPLGIRALQVAAAQRGKPYVYGATGPRAFDCSGLTQYVFSRLGKRLPRTTYQQYAVTRIPRNQLQPGDLIFTGDLGHVGIYAGYGSEWNAPHTGARVRLERVWDRNYKVGRVR